jgi:formate hydrogenlyase transcriptional activator
MMLPMATEESASAPIDFRVLIDSIPALVHTALPDGNLDYFNRPWLEYVGIPMEELLGMGWTVAIHPEDVAGMVAEWRACVAGGKPLQYEARVRRADGGYRWMFHRAVPFRNEGGEIVRWSGSAIDIEDRKRSEEKVRQSESELRRLIDAIPQHVIVFDPDGSLRHVNQVGLEYTRLTLEEIASKDAFARVLHPDDLQKALDARHKAITQGIPVDTETRVLGADGRYRWFLIRINPLRDEQGRILRWYGSSTDIDDLKRAEEQVHEREAELRQILDLAPQHVVVLGPDGKRHYANRRALDFYGLTLEEWQSSSDRLSLYHPDDRERVSKELLSRLASGIAREVEIRIRGKDGSHRWFLAHSNPLLDELGRVTRWYITGTDIEERKQAEERLRHENIALRDEIDKVSMFEEIVGTSPALEQVLARVAKVAHTDSTVLLTGETGTGKELVARAIHKLSARSARAFVCVNCAAIPQNLIASELFGHEKGAFTGALQRRLGRFEIAEGGTIFLDEIGDLPAETQVALLRVLQEHEFERVGASRSIHVDVRVIAATNSDLQAAIAAGTFRSDLFYRLNVFPLELPPLRERKEDIPLLVRYFIARYANKAGKKIRSVQQKTLDLFQAYPWPGNIRELQNVIERSIIVCDTDVLKVDERWLSREAALTPSPGHSLGRRLDAEQKQLIEAALAEARGRVSGPSGAAAKLGVPASTLESKIRSLRINKYRFRHD